MRLDLLIFCWKFLRKVLLWKIGRKWNQSQSIARELWDGVETRKVVFKWNTPRWKHNRCLRNAQYINCKSNLQVICKYNLANAMMNAETKSLIQIPVVFFISYFIIQVYLHPEIHAYKSYPLFSLRNDTVRGWFLFIDNMFSETAKETAIQVRWSRTVSAFFVPMRLRQHGFEAIQQFRIDNETARQRRFHNNHIRLLDVVLSFRWLGTGR